VSSPSASSRSAANAAAKKPAAEFIIPKTTPKTMTPQAKLFAPQFKIMQSSCPSPLPPTSPHATTVVPRKPPLSLNGTMPFPSQNLRPINRPFPTPALPPIQKITGTIPGQPFPGERKERESSPASGFGKPVVPQKQLQQTIQDSYKPQAKPFSPQAQHQPRPPHLQKQPLAGLSLSSSSSSVFTGHKKTFLEVCAFLLFFSFLFFFSPRAYDSFSFISLLVNPRNLLCDVNIIATTIICIVFHVSATVLDFI
jgi:hypothetical protein